MKHQSISVIIPAYNAERYIDCQLNALANQFDAPPFDVLICDNGSQDGTTMRAEAWTTRLNVRIVDASKRRGAAFARNRGIAATDATLLLFCDADDIVDTNWVRNFSKRMPVEDIPALGSGSFIVWNGELPLPSAQEFSLPQVCTFGRPTIRGSGCLAATRSALKALHGFDTTFSGGNEDIDFGLRASEAGIPIISVPEASIYYRQRTSSIEYFHQRRRYAREGVLLWVRYVSRNPAIQPPQTVSWRSTAVRLISSLPLLLRVADRDSQRRLGIVAGELEGNIKYRLFHLRDQPEFLGLDS